MVDQLVPPIAQLNDMRQIGLENDQRVLQRNQDVRVQQNPKMQSHGDLSVLLSTARITDAGRQKETPPEGGVIQLCDDSRRAA
ncbi:hypothetical protein M3A49_35395 [Paraburkholderia sp. CNPSo 3076]|uniref:hypothetical protein n=1 Tax=Paraburkholderia sp. CNPSo 3076 TaxID=2940936 RepID=UPI002257334C|nr:hypothetical protein [Paraburkholderia sp. CNPSo 3076]MCX5544692.1 hypothetical protein [Paraburkholderia sp. CNPSo 3076]